MQSPSRIAFFAVIRVLLAVALVGIGQALFYPDLRLPISLSKNATWFLAAVVTLLGMVLAAVWVPGRADAPGLQPHPPDLPQEEPIPSPSDGEVEGTTAEPSPQVPARTLPTLNIIVMLRSLGVLLSLVLAFGAQLVFLRATGTPISFLSGGPEGQTLAAGSALLALGMVLFGALAMRPAAALAPFELAQERAVALAPDLRRPWFLAWLAISLALFGFAMGRFEGGGENGAVLFAWVAGVVTFLVALWHPGQIRFRIQIAPQERVYLLLLAGLLVVALAMRTYRLTTLPYDLDGDFASHGLQARALATGEVRRIFTLGWANIPMLGFAPSALTMKVFGTGLVGLDAAGIIEGLLIIVGVYLFGRDLFRPRVGLLAAALLTVSYTHLHFSRTSEYIDPAFFMVFAVYFMAMGLRRGSSWAFALSGIFGAFGFQMYYSGRILFFIIGALFIYALLFHRPWLRARWPGAVIWLLGLFIALGPSLILFMRDWEGFVERSRSVFLFYQPVLEHLYNKYSVDTVQQVMWEQAKRTLLVFHYYHDTSTQFGFLHPLIGPFTAPVFALGIGYSLRHLRRLGHFLLVSWIALILVIGCFLTNNAPFWPRLVGLLPPAVLLAAVAIDRVVEPVERLLASWAGTAARLALAVILAAAIAYIGLVNWSWYVEAKGDWAMTRTRIARYLKDLEPEDRAYLVPEPYSYSDREFSFLAPNRFLNNLSEEQVSNGDFSLVQNGATHIVLTPNHVSVIDALQERFQEGISQQYPDNAPGSIGFYVFTIPPRS